MPLFPTRGKIAESTARTKRILEEGRACMRDSWDCYHEGNLDYALESYVGQSELLYQCARNDRDTSMFFPASLSSCGGREAALVRSREIIQRFVPDFYELPEPPMYTSIYQERDFWQNEGEDLSYDTSRQKKNGISAP